MKRKSRQNPEIREFILRNLGQFLEISPEVVRRFGISRTAANRYVHRLEEEALVVGTGKTTARRYALKNIVEITRSINVIPGMYESEVWRENIDPILKDNLPQNVLDICLYGFTEIFNNVIDHSESQVSLIRFIQNYTTITMDVIDYGVGIFEKIQKDFGFTGPRAALLELSKGKLTSDKTKHSGEGIFFTSRMFNQFSILSGRLYYRRRRQDDWGWLIDTENVVEYTQGTVVSMTLSTDANWTTKEIFERYEAEDRSFARTHVPISLAKYGNEQLVSRSQAKRVLARFDRFQEVFLDFQGVDQIGQAFADEIFRVFRNEHPEIRILAINTNPDIDGMIAHVTTPERRGLINSGPPS